MANLTLRAKGMWAWQVLGVVMMGVVTGVVALPIVDPGLFVIQGVSSCLNGTGYCMLGNNCSVDVDFLPDNTEGHCRGLRDAFTPQIDFVCCRYNPLGKATSDPPTTTLSSYTITDVFSIIDHEVAQQQQEEEMDYENLNPENLIDIVGVVTDFTGIIGLVTRPWTGTLPTRAPTPTAYPTSTPTPTPTTTPQASDDTQTEEVTETTENYHEVPTGLEEPPVAQEDDQSTVVASDATLEPDVPPQMDGRPPQPVNEDDSVNSIVLPQDPGFDEASVVEVQALEGGTEIVLEVGGTSGDPGQDLASSSGQDLASSSSGQDLASSSSGQDLTSSSSGQDLTSSSSGQDLAPSSGQDLASSSSGQDLASSSSGQDLTSSSSGQDLASTSGQDLASSSSGQDLASSSSGQDLAPSIGMRPPPPPPGGEAQVVSSGMVGVVGLESGTGGVPGMVDEAGGFPDGEDLGDLDYYADYPDQVLLQPVNQNICGFKGLKNYIPQEWSSRILGGVVASTVEWCWVAAIMERRPGGNKYLCSGALVESDLLLTTASCLQRLESRDLSRYIVVLGDSNLRDHLPYGIQFHSLAEVVVHPDYYTSGGAHANDIGVIRLMDHATLSDNICLVCLAQQDAIFPVRTCTVTGYGLDRLPPNHMLAGVGDLVPSDGVLRQLAVPLLQKRECQAALRNVTGSDILASSNSFLCAGGLDQAAACYSSLDGGSPLACEAGGRWFLAGLVSWSRGCTEPGTPSVYTRISSFTSWTQATYLRMLGFLTHHGYSHSTRWMHERLEKINKEFA